MMKGPRKPQAPFRSHSHSKYLFAFLILLIIGCSTLLREVKGSPDIKVTKVEPEEYTPTTVIENEELFVLTNVTKLELGCSAHFPVEWTFSGDASPLQLEVRTMRTSGPKLGKPLFSAQLKFYRISSQLSGSYRCRSVLNPEKAKKVHIFAQEKGYRGQDPVLIKYGQKVDVVLDSLTSEGEAEEGMGMGMGMGTVIIPCSSWNPKSQISLFKKNPSSGKFEILEPQSAYNYDPKKGFEVKLGMLEKAWWGEYMCSPANMGMGVRTFDRVLVNLLRKPGFKITPPTENVEVLADAEGTVGEDNDNESTLRLRCEGKDDVTLLINGGIIVDDSRAVFEKSHNPSQEYPFIASLTYSNLLPEDSAEISCVGANGQILHKWKYMVVSEFDLKRRGIVKYHSRRQNLDWFACWARTSVAPDFTFVRCSNPVECQIRGHCLRNGNKCDSALVELCSGGCAKASIENQTGILQCRGDGVAQQIMQFMGTSGTYLYNSMIDAPKDEKMIISGKHVFKVGSTGDFECKGSTFLYSGGFRWGLKTKGDALKVLEPSSPEVIQFEETFLPSGFVQARAQLRLNSPNLSQVHCFAPFWNATDWDSRTHPIFIQG